MKKSLSYLLALLLPAFLTTAKADVNTELKKHAAQNRIAFMSFNIRHVTEKDGPNGWPFRRQMVSDLIRHEMPDFLGTQETQRVQSDYLQKKLPEYAVLQKERDAIPSARSEMCGVFYRKDRWLLDPKEHGTFWLSATPEVPGSMGPKAGCPRVVTWGRFVEKTPSTQKETGRAVYVYNIHFDHRSDAARRQAAKLVAKRMATRRDPKTPAVLMGDFNASETSWPIRYLLGKIPGKQPPLQLVDPFRMLHPKETTVGTFTGFKQGATGGAKIDYLFTTPGLKPIEAKILHDAHEGRYPSDHFPVVLKIEFP